jgi:hypothetical protein
MRIATPAQRATINFEDLALGTVFTSPDDQYPGPFLKMEEQNDSNAVDLETGNTFFFQDYEPVIPWHNAYLTLE